MVDFPFCYVSLSWGVSSMFQSGIYPQKKNVNPWQVQNMCRYKPSLTLRFSPLKMDGWKMKFVLGWPQFQWSFVVSFRECKFWGVPNECFGRFATGKKRPSNSEVIFEQGAKDKKQLTNSTYVPIVN